MIVCIHNFLLKNDTHFIERKKNLTVISLSSSLPSCLNHGSSPATTYSWLLVILFFCSVSRSFGESCLRLGSSIMMGRHSLWRYLPHACFGLYRSVYLGSPLNVTISRSIQSRADILSPPRPVFLDGTIYMYNVLNFFSKRRTSPGLCINWCMRAQRYLSWECIMCNV